MKISNSNLVINCAITGTAIVAGLLVAQGISGLSGTTVQGTVQLDGTTVPLANIVFIAEDSSVDPIAVKADQNGLYEVSTNLPAGPYRVIAKGTASTAESHFGDRNDELDDYQRQMITSRQQAREGIATIPESYGAIETSPLRIEIVDGTPLRFDLDLKSNNMQLADRERSKSSIVR